VRQSRLRVSILLFVVLALFAVLGLRLWSLQVVQAGRYGVVAEGNRVREVVDAAARGRIVDDQGRALVSNRTSLVMTVDRSTLDRLPDHGAAVLRRLAGVLGRRPADLKAEVRFCSLKVRPPCWNGSPYQPIPVSTDVQPEQALAVLEHPDRFPGIAADAQSLPTYPMGSLAAHELGYTGPVTEGMLAKDSTLQRNDLVGLAGLELSYDKDLRGRDGVTRLAVDRFGRVAGEVGRDAPKPGNTVVLSLDAGVQQTLEQALQHALDHAHAQGKPADTASGVVMEASTGRVVAMASLPTYDPSAFVGGISAKDYAALSDPAAGTPLLSRAFQGSSAPGSSFKPVSLTAAVTGGLASLSDIYDCSPSMQVGAQVFHNFEGEAPGSMDLHQALVISCDTIFDRFAYTAWLNDGGLRQAPGLPPAQEVFTRTAREYGFGSQTGVDLPAETAGSLVDRARLVKQYNELKGMYCRRAKNGYPEEPEPAKRATFQRYAIEACQDGYLYNGGAATMLGIGQGAYLSVSPLQMATAYAAVANGGTVYHPRLAKAVLRPDGSVEKVIAPSVARNLPVDPAILAYIRSALGDVTIRGTAAGTFAGFPLDQVHVAGKTGTAEVEGQNDTSWFASFGPVDNPKYVVVVTVPKTGQGALFAAPAVREVWEGIYGINRPAALPGGQTSTTLPTVRADGSVGPSPAAPGAPAAPAGANAPVPAAAKAP